MLRVLEPQGMNGCDPHTDGIVRMKETRDTLCILYCALEPYVPEFFIECIGYSSGNRPLKSLQESRFFIDLTDSLIQLLLDGRNQK